MIKIYFMTEKFKNKSEFIENYIKLMKKQNKNDFIIEKETKKHKDEEYILILKLKLNDEEIAQYASYDTKLKITDWEYKKVCSNISLFYNERELQLRTYTLDMKFKIQCFNIKFLEYANNLKSAKDFNEIVKPTEDNHLNKQWIFYSLNQKDFLARYGSKLLESAIEENNEDLIKEIIDKTLEYYKENQDFNIYILSIISENMNHLSRKYSDFLLDYYDNIEEIEKIGKFKIIEKKISSSEYIYNNFDHIHSFCIELKPYNSIFNLNFSGNFIRCDICCFICLICYIHCDPFMNCDGCFETFINILYTKYKVLIMILCSFIIMITFYILSYTKQNNNFLVIAIVFTIFTIFLILSFSRTISKLLIPTDRKPKIKLIVPFPNYVTYPKKIQFIHRIL
jgi:hypothetical protein